MSIKENFMYKKLRKVPEPRLPWKDYVSGLYMTCWSRLTLIQNVSRNRVHSLFIFDLSVGFEYQ